MTSSTGPGTGLVLASASSIRRDMLRAAGVAFQIRPADVDEDEVKWAPRFHSGRAGGEGAADLAGVLAEAKALAGSEASPGALVIGADSVVEAPDGALVSKPATREAAWAQLMALRGASHRIVSAAALARDGAVVWRGVEEARLTVRAFSEAWLEDYLDREWEEIRWCVGGYRMEALGVQLFDKVEGSHHAVLGLPLLPLLAALRAEGVLAG